MAIIGHNAAHLTLVNVFHVKPENQQALVDLLVKASHETMTTLDGFISASIHKSGDGRRVVNYAQWHSREDFDAMLKNGEAQPHLREAAALAESFDPILCDLVESIDRES